MSFNSSSPRFKQDKNIQIVTGQDLESGNLYIIKDDKQSLGPGYYKNHDDIAIMKAQFENAVLRTKDLRNRMQGGGFGSTTSREEGSNIQTALKQKAFQGEENAKVYSSVATKTFNQKLKGK